MTAKVLYIEDEPLLGELFSRVLATHGFETVVAGTGAEGLKRAIEGDFDAVAIDYQLPDTTGIQLARDLLIRFPDLPLLMVTGQGDERLAVEAMTLGIASYVAKDNAKVYLELIPSILRHLLVRAKQRREQRVAEERIRETAQRLSTIVDASPLAILDMDAQGRLVLANPAGRKMFDLPDAAELSERLFQELPAAQDRALAEQALDSVLGGESTEIAFQAKSGGGTGYFNASLAPLPDAAGRIIGAVAMIADATARHHAEQARDAALTEAVQANKAKSTFLATLSHEFRTPLNAIIGFADAMRSEVHGPLSNAHYSEYINHIVDSGRHMLSLVNEVLDIATIEAGRRELKKENVPVADIVQECIEFFGTIAQEGNVHLIADIDADVETVNADRRAVVQILQNLISNAIKFTEPGGQILVAASADDDGVMLKVADSGRGIPEDRLARVTEPFFQAHHDEYVSREGSGLGLAIVKSLVEAHEGSLEIRSKAGKGTTIRIIFPH